MSVSDFSVENKVSLPEYWLDKPYYSLDAFFKQKFSQKIYKISLNAGLTCPNRDGTLGRGGCIFCSSGGSGDFAAPLLDRSSIRESLEKGKSLLHHKQTGSRFMAYFQAFTNTYGPVSYLEQRSIEVPLSLKRSSAFPLPQDLIACRMSCYPCLAG